MELVRLGADLLVAASLQPKKRREDMRAALLSEFHSQVEAQEDLRSGTATGERVQEIHWGFSGLRAKADELLGGRHPFHWPLEFPEVFVEVEEPAVIDGRLPLDTGDLLGELSRPEEYFTSGFAAAVGNPPFQGGQKITGSLGTDYRDYLVEYVAVGKRGSADLSAYFFLRARSVIREGGGIGLLATNTIAQGNTREVGLGQLTSDSCIITRAVSSRKWPGVANLEVAHLWLRRGSWAGPRILDEHPVEAITSYLSEPGETEGDPYPLVANKDKSFIGSLVNGLGFVLAPEEAKALIEKDPHNRDVLFLYLTGEDLNSRPDQSASRWVINFRDWPLEQAETYPDCMRIVREKVKPERDRNKRKVRRERWWQFGERAAGLYAAAAEVERVLALSLVNNHLGVSFCRPSTVFAHKLVVFPLAQFGAFSLIQSHLHYHWAWKYSSTMRKDINYSPSDCFETFPFPYDLSGSEDIGERYYMHRQGIMQSRQEGMTKTYNRLHDPDEASEDIERLRELHVEMDRAVADAYGWDDLDLGHGFHETKQGVRFTISEEARQEALDRLLLLNHERYAEEVEQGLHDKKAKKGKPKKRTKSKADGGTDSLLGSGDGA